MRPVTRLFTAVLLAAVSVPAVHAADFDLPVVVDEAPEFVPVEIGSGWYLRGDIGYSVASSGGAGTSSLRSDDSTMSSPASKISVISAPAKVSPSSAWVDSNSSSPRPESTRS